jgi:intracellular septation protein
MKQFLDFIPLFLFFAAYKTLGIFPATGVLIGSSVLVYGAIWLKDRHLERSQVITLIATIAFGSITLLLHDETYLKWKAPVINWIFAVIFLGSQFIGDKPIIERMMGHAIPAPAFVWRKLNIAWVLFFIVAGAANLYVAFTYEKYWVDFKVFGSLGMTLTFLIGQMVWLSRYIPHDDDRKKESITSASSKEE